jgi:hypothetical protein
LLSSSNLVFFLDCWFLHINLTFLIVNVMWN